MGFSKRLFWHRKDLRIIDNIALSKALDNNQLVIGLYILDPKIINSADKNESCSPAKEWFLIKSLLELKEKWKMRGSNLIILKGNPLLIIPKLAKVNKLDTVFWNINIEPYEIKRDIEVEINLKKIGVNVVKSWDQTLVVPDQIKTQSDTPYKIYTPFKNNLLKSLESKNILVYETKFEHIKNTYMQKFLKYVKSNQNIFSDEHTQANDFINNSLKKNHFQKYNLCPCLPGEDNAKIQLNKFISENYLNNYEYNKDKPFQDGTSSLSAAINLGTISIRKLWLRAEKASYFTKNLSKIKSIKSWQNELIWREFYQHSLFHFPSLSKGPLKKKWSHFPWEDNEIFLQSWENGLTGVPIVDASIRQLKEIGWMHNRCRMIVASFLVKDLIINWQLGEIFFMKHLVDGDLASNNGGWQWCASSGMDTKPLRIFNPYRQAERFDQDAKFIKKWIPELKHIPSKQLLSGSINDALRGKYPKPIINHSWQVTKFKSKYKKFISMVSN